MSDEKTGVNENNVGSCEDTRYQQGNMPHFTPYEPTKADKMYQYLAVLFEAQKSGHNVHDEISDMLRAYKQELQIA